MAQWIAIVGALLGVALGAVLGLMRENRMEKRKARREHVERVRTAAADFLATASATEHYASVLRQRPGDAEVLSRLDALHEERRLNQLRLAITTESAAVRTTSRMMRTHLFDLVAQAKTGSDPSAADFPNAPPEKRLAETRHKLVTALSVELGVPDGLEGLSDPAD